MSKEYVEIDIRKTTDRSHPIFMQAEVEYDSVTKVLKLISKEGVEYIFNSVKLDTINAGFTHLLGLRSVESGAGVAPEEWAICFAYSFF